MSATDAPRVGFIGLGVMGAPMARNLLSSGYTVTVFNRSREPSDRLAGLGATVATSVRALAATSDVIITMLPDSPDVASVVGGPDGVLAGARPGSLWIDMSSISPIVARELALEAATVAVDAIDAPVSGGEQGAVDGTLSIMVGGPMAAVETAMPILQALGKKILRVGGSGAGQVAKACNQIVVGGTIALAAEALVLARSAGVAPAVVRDALLGGLAQSRVLDVHGERMLTHAFDPGFRMRLHRKDLAIALDMGSMFGAATPIAAEVARLMDDIVEAGGGDLDHAALAEPYENAAGVRLDDDRHANDPV
jgi:2-hydroxy-3-oxopropionate reductase